MADSSHKGNFTGQTKEKEIWTIIEKQNNYLPLIWENNIFWLPDFSLIYEKSKLAHNQQIALLSDTECEV